MSLTDGSCPACGGVELHRSRIRVRDWMLVALHYRPLRCLQCNWRFYVRPPKEGGAPVQAQSATNRRVIRIHLPGCLLRATVARFAPRTHSPTVTTPPLQ